ncbi:MAG: 1-(5-phosphoribosyl)-5-((5-phosphoribosylamino)methylideneamino)imidazole-4-carboxamide isomerase, partial [Candidatus Altiarchaeota archaeon]|nr:1-(5-phosphoribosyl)-5-((5-phosphoribosylamino)methylideneamino)imidazole-4-carboxamide isomerase [Candidatus Altiarchaeota archaeon]
MKVIPAIDILDGKCAQLVGGVRGTQKYYGDPVEVANGWVEAGADLLHVIDLDAALGTGDNLGLVVDIKETCGVGVEFGGGIRDVERAGQALSAGIDRIIVGTLAIDDLENGFRVFKQLGREYGRERLMVAVDMKNNHVVVKGWQGETG